MHPCPHRSRAAIATALASALAVCLAVPGPGLARPAEPAHNLAAETRAEVPALHDFHEVIYPIWHEAWPAKDTAMLAEMLPAVEKGASAVAAAELPGILRDKKAAWTSEVERLQAIVEDYRQAVAAKDDQALLDAAERLHGQFEKMVRAIRPVLKEMDAFHVVLYRVYHHELEGQDPARLAASAKELEARMADLAAATLPPRLEGRGAQFAAARDRLAAEVKALAAVAPSEPAAQAAAVAKVHTAWQALEAVFD